MKRRSIDWVPGLEKYFPLRRNNGRRSAEILINDKCYSLSLNHSLRYGTRTGEQSTMGSKGERQIKGIPDLTNPPVLFSVRAVNGRRKYLFHRKLSKRSRRKNWRPRNRRNNDINIRTGHRRPLDFISRVYIIIPAHGKRTNDYYFDHSNC